jgi:hypothetical protein
MEIFLINLDLTVALWNVAREVKVSDMKIAVHLYMLSVG